MYCLCCIFAGGVPQDPHLSQEQDEGPQHQVRSGWTGGVGPDGGGCRGGERYILQGDLLPVYHLLRVNNTNAT